MTCDRPKCRKTPTDPQDLYCSDECYELDYGPPVQPIDRNKTNGFGAETSRMTPEAVRLSYARQAAVYVRRRSS